MLLRSQVAAVVRVVREDEVEADSAEDGQHALDEKKPAPASNSSGALEAGDDATGEKATNSRGDTAGGVEDADTLGFIRGFVSVSCSTIVCGIDKHTDFITLVVAGDPRQSGISLREGKSCSKILHSHKDRTREQASLNGTKEEASDQEAFISLGL